MSFEFAKYKREISVAAAYLALLLVLAVAAPRFYDAEFHDTWVNAAPMLVMAIGATLVIVARHIDISVGSQFSVCAVAAGLLAKAGMPTPVVIGATVAAGAAMGALNGVLVAGMGLPSIVVTLATMVIFGKSLSWVRQGEWVANLPAGFQWFGQSQATGQGLIVIIAIAIFAVFAWASRWLAAGREVYAVGSDQEAARLAGIRPRRLVFGVFVLMGALVGIAALLQSVRFAEVDPNAGEGLELQVIAAVVVGGTAITGGRGTMFGSLIGVVLLGTIGAAMVFLTRQAQWDKAIEGAIILAAVASDGFSRRGRRA
ncbi:MAG TPA: ABC transporter permease [Tepidisphaeraceae bacterium]|jgi:rhamnose transport system permease protein|nr:ABC transporter permease [Tepidisphaeraceae bacterium]